MRAQPKPPHDAAPGALGLYVHVPFCARRCDYCDFFVVPGALQAGIEDSYFETLTGETLDAVTRRKLQGRHLDSLYVGGGTPSFASAMKLGTFIAFARELFNGGRGSDPEITLEANPESVTAASAASWRQAGINRISLGAQSFDDAVLAPRGRLHTAQGTREAFRIAREAGFDNIGIDLIGGLPGETTAGFRRGLDAVLELGPEHVSVYLLETAESGKDSPLARAVTEGRARLTGESEVVEMYEGAVAMLTKAGYRQYEISNFAKPGRESRHNLKYWRSLPYLGLGPSAHSFIHGRRHANPADLGRWTRAVQAGAPPMDYTLESADQRAREALVLELRLIEGVDMAQFARRWGLDPRADLAQTLDELDDAGLVRRREGRLALTPRGVLLSNEVFGRIL
jgi:oxygen-independent coproporphyrinogen-3 oxidase